MTELITEVLLIVFFACNVVFEHSKRSIIASVIVSWGTHSDENNQPGTIVSSNVVCMGSPVIIMLQKKANKHVQVKIMNSKFD